MQETQVWSLIWGDPTCHGATKPMGRNYWACAQEPWSLHTRARWGACLSPLESGLHSPQLGERVRSEEDPAEPESELDRLKESRKFSPKLTHRQPNSVSSENYEAQNTFRKAQETAPRIWTRGKSQSRGSEGKRGTWILFQFPTTVSL